MLRIAIVELKGPKGSIKIPALFDEGSTATIIEESIADQLQLKGVSSPVTYRWTNGMRRHEHDSKIVQLEVSNQNLNSKFFTLKNTRTTIDIGLPRQKIDVDQIVRLCPMVDLKLLESIRNEKPKLLIGSNNAGLIVPLQTRQYNVYGLQLTKSHLGWTIHGCIDDSQPMVDESVNMNLEESDLELTELVKLQYKIDNFGSTCEKPRLSADDEKALSIMSSTLRKVGNRYEIGHLYKYENLAFPTAASKALAKRRLKITEGKMDRNPEFGKQYVAKIEDYVAKGFARKLLPGEEVEDHKTFYLSHFGVYNANKPGKFRLVFDAKAKAAGYSLNDLLLKGPDFVPPLIAVIWRARAKKYAFLADIAEMFHQILIRKEDQNSQRFLFRGHCRDREPDVYVMNAMIFGAISSPSKAQYVKNKNAEEQEHIYRGVRQPIEKQHYVDDFFHSESSLQQAIQTIDNVRAAHANGGFQLVKWTTNNDTLTNHLPEELRAPTAASPYGERVLGIYWDTKSDQFVFPLDFVKFPEVKDSNKKHLTKRFILRFVMSIFDPVGFLNPLTIRLKILFQDVWRENITWDKELDGTFAGRLQKWLQDVDNCKPVRVSRQYFPEIVNYSEVDLVTFCDASENGYCAVSYYLLRKGGVVYVSLVQSKARVAPLKPALSIPKLELQAMALGSQLCDMICSETNLIIRKRHLWTDSEIALNWLKTDKKLTAFANARVGKILNTTKIEEWNWLPSSQNVADMGTKELPLLDLSINSVWFTGPQFLQLPEDRWPSGKLPDLTDPEKLILFQKEVEEETEFINVHITVDNIIICERIDITRFSNYHRLIRATAYALKMIELLVQKKIDRPKTITIGVTNLREANKLWIKKVQMEIYADEISDLIKNGIVKTSSKLYKLSPIINDGIVKINGRIPGRDPIILPKNHPFTKLLVEMYHKINLHQGQEATLASIREQYWIPRSRDLLRPVARKCMKCKAARSLPTTPIMGYLPPERLEAKVHPFTYVGIDYFGPLFVSEVRRHEKRWVALFTCLTVRAVHVEIVHSLTTSSMILALSRFFSIRGVSRKIFSDNGTNFKGAHNELRQFIDQLKDDKIEDTLSIRNVEWKFIPPGAPHMGGCWERYVQSIKTAVTAVLKDQYPREEVLLTALYEAMNVVYNRPLTDLSEDPKDL